jgi:hypothetical protein
VKAWTINRLRVPELSQWPVNSTRFVLPVVAVRGWMSTGKVRVIVAWWIWRADWEIRRAER